MKYTIDRQKKTVDEITDKNKGLEEEIKFYEQLRIKEGKKKQTFAGVEQV